MNILKEIECLMEHFKDREVSSHMGFTDQICNICINKTGDKMCSALYSTVFIDFFKVTQP